MDDLEQTNISQEEIPTFEEFKSEPIHYKYTPMSCEDMLRFMSEHDDCYVACDFKDDAEKTFEYLVEEAKRLKVSSVLERIIVSLNKYDEYECIINIYPFTNLAIRQYEANPHNYYELAEFCLINNIPVCMIKTSYLNAGDDISILLDHGIKVFAAVVNDLVEFDNYMKIGISGCVSDYLYETDLVYIE